MTQGVEMQDDIAFVEKFGANWLDGSVSAKTVLLAYLVSRRGHTPPAATGSVREAQDKRRGALIERLGTVADLACATPFPGDLGDVAYDLLREAAAQIASDRQHIAAAPTPDAAASEDELRYLIRKGGYYYRPNAHGYTSHKTEAGRYTLAEAIKHSHPNGPDGTRDGMDYELADAAASEAGEAGDPDSPCTDCDDTGMTFQTERPCSCGAGEQFRTALTTQGGAEG